MNKEHLNQQFLNVSRKAKALPSQRTSIMRCSAFSSEEIFLYWKYLVPIFSNTDEVVTSWSSFALRRLPKKQWSSEQGFPFIPFFFFLWSRLGHRCDERINISFCTLGCFPCSNSHVGASEAADEVGGICGWTQRSCRLAKQEWFVGI